MEDFRGREDEEKMRRRYVLRSMETKSTKVLTQVMIKQDGGVDSYLDRTRHQGA
jgi:hypothetical protein